jgi:hypothetical protein
MAIRLSPPAWITYLDALMQSCELLDLIAYDQLPPSLWPLRLNSRHDFRPTLEGRVNLTEPPS